VADGRRRQRTRYTIIQQGRTALDGWLGTAPATPSLEFEALLRMILADQGSLDDLRAAIAATTLQAREMRATGIELTKDLLTTGGPLPERLHLTERAVTFYAEFVLLVLRWCDETSAEIETWPDTRDVGLTPKARERLERVINLPDH
jgi:PadR family transcriptional regulator AphA